EVEEVVDPGELLPCRVVEPELRLGQVAEHRLDPLGPPALVQQPLELLGGALADEDVDVAIALEQPLDEVAADEARRAGDEVGHAPNPIPVRRTAAPPPARWRSGRGRAAPRAPARRR